jgi:hypothetical protein
MGIVTPTMVSQAAANRLSKLWTRTPSTGVLVRHHAPPLARRRPHSCWWKWRCRAQSSELLNAAVGGQAAADFRGADVCSGALVAFAVFNSRKARSASSSQRHPPGAPRQSVRVYQRGGCPARWMTCLCVFCKAEYSIAARRLQMHSCHPSGTASRQEHARRPYRCSQRACRCDSAPGRCESARASWAFSGHLHRICTCARPSVGVACMIRRGRTSLVRNNETADAPVSAAASATTPGLYISSCRAPASDLPSRGLLCAIGAVNGGPRKAID